MIINSIIHTENTNWIRAGLTNEYYKPYSSRLAGGFFKPRARWPSAGRFEMRKNNPSTNECAQILRAISDETRLLMIKCLFDGEKCGTDIATELRLPQPQIAHHLGILKHARLVQSRREGQRVYYRLHPMTGALIKDKAERAINLGCCKISFRP